MPALSRRSLLIASTAAMAGASARAAEAPPAIAAASDLQHAFDRVIAAFRSRNGLEARVVYGSSGNFTRQIQQGAPFQMFLSADEGFVFQLADAGMTVDRGTLYGEGRIVLFAPTGSPIKPDAGLTGLRSAVAAGAVQRFAIANPEHAPYGRAAEQALKSQGLWDALRPSLVLGENVSQAAQFALSGSAQGGIFAYSLTFSDEVAKRGSFALIPSDWHAALRQRMVLLKNAGTTARALYDFMQGPEARAILRQYGFSLPNETV